MWIVQLNESPLSISNQNYRYMCGIRLYRRLEAMTTFINLRLKADFAHHVAKFTLMVIISSSLVVVHGTNIHHEMALHANNRDQHVCCIPFYVYATNYNTLSNSAGLRERTMEILLYCGRFCKSAQPRTCNNMDCIQKETNGNICSQK